MKRLCDAAAACTAGIPASIGCIWDSLDHAMAEALNRTFKAELVKLHRPWRTHQQVDIAVIEWFV